MERGLTEQGGVLVIGGGHGRVYCRLAVTGREFGPGVVPALVIVVLDVQVDQLGVIDAERTARVVDVLTIQGLSKNGNKFQVYLHVEPLAVLSQ